MSARRSNGDGSTPVEYRPGKYRANVAVGGVRRTVYGSTPSECRRKARDLVTQAETTGVAPRASGTLTLAAYGEAWIAGPLAVAVADGSLTAKHARDQVAAWRNHAAPVIGARRVGKVTETDVALVDAAVVAKGLGGASRRAVAITVRKVLAAAVRDGYLPRNPAKGDDVRLPRATRVKPAKAPHTADDVVAILARAKGHRLYPLLVAYLTTGKRRSEWLEARWSNLDLDGGQGLLPVGKRRDDTGRRPLAPIPLDPRLVAALRAHRTAQLAERMAASAWADPDLVFTTTLGTPLAGRNVLRWLVSVGCHDVHTLRASYATAGLAAGMSPTDLAANLGHSVAVLLSTYVRATSVGQKAATAAVSDQLLGAVAVD